MKLLSRNTGWAAYSNTLYWTNNGGEDWTDTTPIPPELRRAAVTLHVPFFRDKSEGWVIISNPEQVQFTAPEALANAKTVYSIAHTVDSGVDWSFVPLTFPELPQSIQDTVAGPAGLYFLDSLHGWLDIRFEGLSKPGKLLETEDGGRTWKWVANPPVSGEINFLSSQDGWLVSGSGGDQLYVTHDGCKTWQEVSLSPPPQVGTAIYPTFQGPPIFQGRQKGSSSCTIQGTLALQLSWSFIPRRIVVRAGNQLRSYRRLTKRQYQQIFPLPLWTPTSSSQPD